MREHVLLVCLLGLVLQSRSYGRTERRDMGDVLRRIIVKLIFFQKTGAITSATGIVGCGGNNVKASED
jgi:hypothetical protein